MLREYRRRFVVLTMALVTAVLLISFVIQFFVQYRSAVNELRNTMRLVVSPWDAPGERFEPLDMEPPPEPPEGSARPDMGDVPDLLRRTDEEIAVAFYDMYSDTLSILSRHRESLDSALIAAAAPEARRREESFGILREYGLIYYREGIQGGCRLAFADISFLRTRMLNSALSLLAVFEAALGLFFLISLRLSKAAARPMEQAVEMERQFVTDISHDLKTPITVILANDSILRAAPEARVGEQQQWIESTDMAARNMLQLVDEMLTLSSLDSSAPTVTLQPVDFSDAAEKSVLQLESLAYERQVILETEIAEGLMVLGDRQYLERICSGLVDNALKYGPAGGCVKVSLRREKKRVLFRVRNTGSVIAGEDLPHIFERFYRGDKSRTGQQGHGLGLPIIRSMTEAMHGEIHAESDEGKGTVFTVSLQAADP